MSVCKCICVCVCVCVCVYECVIKLVNYGNFTFFKSDMRSLFTE